jgi:hypothetical protein
MARTGRSLPGGEVSLSGAVFRDGTRLAAGCRMMKPRSLLFLSPLLVTTVFVLAGDARAASGSSLCPACSVTSDCEAGANCFNGHCVFYDETSGGGTATAQLSTGAGGAAGGAGSARGGAVGTGGVTTGTGGGTAGTGGGTAGTGGGIAGTGGGIDTGAAGTGGCVSDAECQVWWPGSKCLSTGACLTAPCVTNADCIAPAICEPISTPGYSSCVIYCAWRAGSPGTGGGSATGGGGGSGSSGGFAGGGALGSGSGSSGTATGSSTSSGFAGSGALGGGGGRGPANGAAGAGNAWHIGNGCAVGGVSGGRAGAFVVLLAFAALRFRGARRAPSRRQMPPRPR